MAQKRQAYQETLASVLGDAACMADSLRLQGARLFGGPLSSEDGTYTAVKARFWPWLSGESHQNLARCSLFARTRSAETEMMGER